MHFTAGVALLKDPGKPRYEEAYREFKAAYAISKNPKVLGNVAFCAMKLERDAEAIEAYERYVKEVPDLAEADRAQIERDLLTLRAGIVKVTVESRPPGATLVDTRVPAQGEAITNFHPAITVPTTLTLRRGHHVLKAKLAGREDAIWEIDAEKDDPTVHVFELADANPAPAGLAVGAAPAPLEATERVVESRPLTAPVYVSAGVTAALGVATIITGVVASQHRKDFNQANGGNDPAEATRLRDSGQTLNVTTDVLLGGTLVGLAVTSYFFFTRPTHAERVPVQATAGGMSVTF